MFTSYSINVLIFVFLILFLQYRKIAGEGDVKDGTSS